MAEEGERPFPVRPPPDFNPVPSVSSFLDDELLALLMQNKDEYKDTGPDSYYVFIKQQQAKLEFLRMTAQQKEELSFVMCEVDSRLHLHNPTGTCLLDTAASKFPLVKKGPDGSDRFAEEDDEFLNH